jgi:hypothetical protein
LGKVVKVHLVYVRKLIYSICYKINNVLYILNHTPYIHFMASYVPIPLL